MGSHVYYSLLTKALVRGNIIRHIGWAKKTSLKSIDVPNTVELLIWLFGSRSQEKWGIISETDADLDKLDVVLENENALNRLRKSNDLEDSYIQAIESRFALRRKLIRIDETIRSLISESYEVPYPDRDVLKIAESIQNTADILLGEIGKKIR